ncbi:hypothetical protein E8E11_000110 [Didymella keratinophila]|nr:hypothetical protein E8E11_000110 [Didymella keratinophila]
MPDTSNDLDDVRYDHHLKHRGSANQKIFVVVWTTILAFLLFNFGRTAFTSWGRRTSRAHRVSTPASTRPSASKRVLAYIDAIAELPIPQLLRRTLTEISVGKVAALASYSLIVVALLLSVDAPKSTPHFVDDVAFRAAWVTVTQIPLVFLLSTKHGVFNFLANASYERVLWLHKWAGRMVFVSATTHVVIMQSSISIMDILFSQDKSATAVRYGIGSYFFLIWIAITSMLPRLKKFHTEWLSLPCPNATTSPTTSLTAYVDGPYGAPPCWESYENLILIVTSTGVSFALSILDYLEHLCLSNESQMRTQVIRFVWTVRHIDPQFETTVAEMLRRYGTTLKDSGVRIESELYVTCQEAELETSLFEVDQFAHLRPRLPRYGSGDRSLTIRNPDEIYDEWEEEERQWAEMEALEELQMQQIDPFEDANEVSSVPCDEDAAARDYDGEGYATTPPPTYA